MVMIPTDRRTRIRHESAGALELVQELIRLALQENDWSQTVELAESLAEIAGRIASDADKLIGSEVS